MEKQNIENKVSDIGSYYTGPEGEITITVENGLPADEEPGKEEEDGCEYTIIVRPVKAGMSANDKSDQEVDEDSKGVSVIEKAKSGDSDQLNGPFVLINNEKWNFMHMDSAEKKENGYECGLCNKPIANLSKYREHYSKVHRTKVGYRCFCKRFFAEEASYEKHKKKFQSRHIPCSLCDSVFDSELVLKEHMKSEHGKELKPVMKEEEKFGRFACERCGVVLQHMNLLEQHKENFPDCSKEMSQDDQQKDLALKEIIYSNKKGEMETVTYGDLLNEHDNPPFVCKVCEVQHDKKFAFARHLLCHVSEGTHMCPVCGCKVKGKDGLYKHMKKHLARPYKCETCASHFTSEAELKAHLSQGCKVLHKCDICDFIGSS